jgi:transcriptional regulator with XRE-family HTH domain
MTDTSFENRLRKFRHKDRRGLNRIAFAVIREVRESKGISVQRLTDALEIPYDTWVKYEYGTRSPRELDNQKLNELYALLGEDSRLDFLRTAGTPEESRYFGIYFGLFEGFFSDSRIEDSCRQIAEQYKTQPLEKKVETLKILRESLSQIKETK